MNYTLSLPKARNGIARAELRDRQKLGEKGPFRILMKPEARGDLRQYYSTNSGGMFWTQMREVAREFEHLHLAQNILKRLIANNAKLKGRVEIIPV